MNINDVQMLNYLQDILQKKKGEILLVVKEEKQPQENQSWWTQRQHDPYLYSKVLTSP